MNRRAKRRPGRNLRVGTTFGALIALAAGLSGCSGDEPSRAAKATPPARSTPAEGAAISGLFSVNEHKLFLNCSAGTSPAVVFVADLTRTGDDGDLLAARLPDDRRFCRYDRAALGVSTAASSADLGTPTTGADAVSDLHELLRVAGVPRPVVLVGAGYGGLVATMHAATHPDDVAGLVLAGPLLPDEWDLLDHVPAKDARAVEQAWEGNSEHVAVRRTLAQAKALAVTVPDVPMVLIDAHYEESPAGWDWKAIRAAHSRQLRAFAGAFPDHQVIRSDSEAPLENEAPEEVVAQVKTVLAELG